MSPPLLGAATSGEGRERSGGGRVLGSVGLAGFLGMVKRMQMVAVRGMSVLGRIPMVVFSGMLGRFAVMLGGVFVVLGRHLVMFGDAVGVRHHGAPVGGPFVRVGALAVGQTKPPARGDEAWVTV
jgi:hypothetical protein